MNRYSFITDTKLFSDSQECFHCKGRVWDAEDAKIEWHNENGDRGVFHCHKGECENEVNNFCGG